MKRFILLLIVFLAFVLRIVWIDKYPVGFTADEASFGYDAYSILNTGKDQWGQAWPITLRSFGDFKLPLYTYLTIPSIAVFGLNQFSVRLPSALVGALAVLVTYFFVVELFKKKNLALTASFLLAISPWHIQLSRGAFEANLTTLFLPLGIFAFLKGLQKPKWFILSAFSFALNLYSYHSARLVTPLLVFFLVYLKRKEIVKNRRAYFSAAIFLLFLIPSVFQFFSFNSRSADIAIFNPTGGWGPVADRRYEGDLMGLPDSVSRAFSNKITYTGKLFVENYLSYFSPRFLFTGGVNNGTYGMVPGIAVLYLIELPFLIAASWYSLRNKLTDGLPIKLLCFWILISPIPAALTKGSGFAGNRSAVMMPALQIFSAFGAVVLFGLLNKKLNKKILFSFFSLIFVLSIAFLGEEYIYHSPRQVADQMLYGRKEAIDFIKPIEGNYKEIVFSRSLSEPQIFVAFYNRWDPLEYQKETKDWLRYESEKKPFLDQLDGYKLGKYTFGDLHYQTKKNNEKTLFVGKPDDFPNDTSFVKEIYYPDGKAAISVAESIVI